MLLHRVTVQCALTSLLENGTVACYVYKGAHAFDSSVSEQGRTLQLAAGVGVETCSAPC